MDLFVFDITLHGIIEKIFRVQKVSFRIQKMCIPALIFGNE